MARFNIDTFDPIYPEGNDKKGEIQLIQIREAAAVDETWSKVTRLDLLDCFRSTSDPDLRTTPVGRQTMMRQVISSDANILWAGPIGNNSFLALGALTTANVGFFEFVRINVQEYEDLLNQYIAAIPETASVRITKVHIINSHIQYAEKGNDHMFFHTYDCIFYGQQSPNPYEPPIPPVPPPPPCEQYLNYGLTLNYPPPATRGTASVVGGNIGELILLPKGGGGGTQACAALWKIADPVDIFYQTPGNSFALKWEYSPLIAGTTINVTIKWQGVTITTIQMNSTGQTIYVPITVLQATNFSFRFEFSNQSPLAGENTVTTRFSLWTDTCVIPT